MNTTGTIYEQLLELIVNKELPPGERINQAELSERLNSSRTPIVKSLHRLEAQGLVEHIPNRGFFVNELSVLELLEVYTLRVALDSIIVYELAGTMTEDQIQQLDELVSSFEASADNPDEEKYREYDQSFHSLLLEFSRNGLVKRIINDFQIYNRCFTAGLLRKPQDTLPEHRRLFEAIKNGDREAARNVSEAHMSKTKTLLEELVERLRQVGIDPGTIRFREIDFKVVR